NLLLPSQFGIAYGTVDMRVGVRGAWEVDIGEQDDRIRAVQRVRGIAWTPWGSLLVAAADKLRSFSPAGGLEWQWSPPRAFAFVVSCPQAVAFANNRIMVACDDGEVVLLTVDGRLIKRRREDLTPRWLAAAGD